MKTRLAAAGLCLAAVHGCSLGGSSGGATPVDFPEGIGEDAGEAQPPPFVGGTLRTELETTAPDMDSFLLRGTMPVPPGTFPQPDFRLPLIVQDYDGTPVWTQIQPVSLYPDPADGADVVEILARVRRNPSKPPGTQVRYRVKDNLNPPLPFGDPGTADLGDLEATRNVLPLIQDLLDDPTGIEIAAYDVFGHKYVSRPLDPAFGGDIELRRVGRAHSEVRVHQTMMPVEPVGGSNGTLPHLFGVHAYISTYSGQEVLGLDLRFHNAHDGNDLATSADDPLGKLYFQRIEVSLPVAYHLQGQYEDGAFGASFFDGTGTRRIRRVVDASPDGRPHVMRWQGQFHRRLMISTTAANDIARAYLDGAGHAICARGTEPGTGTEFWSWWNRDTARYFPQNYQLPSLDHLGIANLRNQLDSSHDQLEAMLLAGTGQGNYPIPHGRLGWMHAYGVPYGGMTGGPEIYCYDGISLAAAKVSKGYRYYEALHRMHTSRQPSALYARDGSPSTVEDWLIEVPGSGIDNDYVPMQHFLLPFLGGSFFDPFGVTSAPQDHANFVAGAGLTPSYEETHLSYDPHDYQHFIRYTRAAKVLLWLGNDSLAKDDILMQAENFHLSYHRYNNNANGAWQVTGMKTALRHVLFHPGVGLHFGRGEAWGCDTMIAAYATQPPDWRNRKIAWYRSIAEILRDGQGTCNGFIQAQVSNRFVDGEYRARQLIEQSLVENMMWGLRETVFRGIEPGYADMVRDTLIDSLYAFISPMSWFPGELGPWTYTGVGPVDMNEPVWCSMAEMAPDAFVAFYDRYQDWSSFAYGYELTGDNVFLDFALTQLGGGDLYTGLLGDGLENLENRSALIALMQRLNGAL